MLTVSSAISLSLLFFTQVPRLITSLSTFSNELLTCTSITLVTCSNRVTSTLQTWLIVDTGIEIQDTLHCQT